MPKQKTTDTGKYNKPLHVPVLLEPVLHYLNPQRGNSYLDLTAGYGGHAQAILEKTAAPHKATLVDRDEKAINYLKARFDDGYDIRQADFLSASEKLAEAGKKFDIILADLGVSSPHLDEAERGFSFSRPGPLDMRMDTSRNLTAADIVNDWNEGKLEQLIRQYGEESKARAVAKAIIRNRPIETTDKLVNAINQVRGLGRHRHINRSTKVFQALRIAVNDELTQLERSLPIWLRLLSPGGRIALISFHSLEDRLVKRFLAEHGGQTYDAELTLLTKKPVLADRLEIALNPRARSAKLRAAVKNKNLQKG